MGAGAAGEERIRAAAAGGLKARRAEFRNEQIRKGCVATSRILSKNHSESG